MAIRYKINDKVIVNGTVDDRHFNNVLAVVISIDLYSSNETNMDAMGITGDYSYEGVNYQIKPLDGGGNWYVPPYNLKRVEDDDKTVRILWYKNGSLK